MNDLASEPAIQLKNFERVNVVGTSGVGKSTVSRRIAETLGYPRIEMDKLFWRPQWTPSEDRVFFRSLEVALEESRWVLDGNYDRTTSVKWSRATAVVWIDYSFARIFVQLLKRSIARIFDRNELWPGTGNRESVRRTFFSADSIIVWAIQTFGRNRRRYEACLRDPRYVHIEFVRLKTPAAVEEFLGRLAEAARLREDA